MSRTVAISQRVASIVTAGYLALDAALIEKYRKDFLLLMRQVPKPRNYDEALYLKSAWEKWSADFTTLFDKRIPAYLNELRVRGLVGSAFVQQKVWKVYSACRGVVETFPLPDLASSMDRDQCFYGYTVKRDKWVRDRQSDARGAWKALLELVDWHQSTPDLPSKKITLHAPETYRQSVEGISVSFVGIEPDSYEVGLTVAFVEGVRLYKRQAARYFPWILKRQLPIEVHSIEESGFTYAGLYEGDRIACTLQEKPIKVVQTLAHEMGHHLYRSELAYDKVQFWRDAMNGNLGELDLDRVIGMMKGDDDDTETLAFRVEKTDPVLYLQLIGLEYSGRVLTKAELLEMKAKGGHVKVQTKPISAYAHKNPEEAFCEVVGLWVTYGPRAVDPEIRRIFQVIVPNIRIGSYAQETL